jgi:hypothetical protein
MLKRTVCGLWLVAASLGVGLGVDWAQTVDELELGFHSPPPEARPHTYWLWLNGYLDAQSARAELQAMKAAGLSGVLVFDMGAQGDKSLQPPPGPAFLSPEWMKQLRQAVGWAKELGLQVDFSVVSSWDLGGHWIEPRHASMGLYPSELTITGGRAIDVELPFPPAPPAAPKGLDGKPVFWRDIAVLAAKDAQRQPGRQTYAFPQASALLDVTSKVDRQGRLRWDAPLGTWTILRYVCMNTGERLKVPSPASDGWATDHLSAEATRAHMDYVIARLRETFGNPAQSGVSNLYLASYEVRGLVWSPGFTDEFQRRRGYDMKPFLPAIFGSTVGGDDTTARFLFDYRKTLGEVLVDAYYRAAGEVAHAAGLSIKSEAGGPGPPVHNVPVDALLANCAVDAIQGEFWPFRPNADDMWVVKETAAAGHVYGKRLIHLESFTSMENWREGPQDLKPSADRVFVEGGNHLVWHTWAHETPAAGKPGWGYHAGTHLNRNRIWWPLAKPFIEYLSRCSYLLQRGRFVADVLYYYGDGGYKFVHARRNEESLGPGYDYDVINSDGILNRLNVRDGRLVLPDGTDYAILVLPKESEAHPAVLEKIEQLVAAGATIVGPKPLRAVGLEGYPASDAKVRDLADRLWGDLDGQARTTRDHGKGRVIWGRPLRDVLAEMGIGRDFGGPEELDHIHRREGSTDLYFVRNARPEAVEGLATFRVGNRRPEFWDPRTGAIEPAAVYQVTPRGVELPLSLNPYGSMFVVFRGPARAEAFTSVTPGARIRMRDGVPWLLSERNGAFQVARGGAPPVDMRVEDLPAPFTLEGGWSVELKSALDPETPRQLDFPNLISWTEHPDPDVRFFSGTGRYRKSFILPAGWKADGLEVDLDLGKLWVIGQAWLNGTPLGVMWIPPFRTDCTGSLREGTNELVVEVSNTWFNRLAGDGRLPPGQGRTRTNVPRSGGEPWAKLEPLPSGLFGPVRLVAVAHKKIPL